MMMMAAADPKHQGSKFPLVLPMHLTPRSLPVSGSSPPVRSESVIVASPSSSSSGPSTSAAAIARHPYAYSSLPDVAPPGNGSGFPFVRAGTSRSSSIRRGASSLLVSATATAEAELDTQTPASDGEGRADEDIDEAINYSTNPNSISIPPSPSSPAGSLSNGNGSISSGGGGSCSGGANSATRRIFTPEFKQNVLDAFTTDPECIGNQRATARKFGIHRRQVQKWLQQLTDNKDQPSDEQRDQYEEEEKQSTTSLRGAPAPTPHTKQTESQPISTILTGTMPMSNIGRSKLPYHHPTLQLQSPPASATATSSSLKLSQNSSLAANMFMGLNLNINTNPLLPGNLSFPLSSDNSRHSPRVSPIGVDGSASSTNTRNGLSFNINPLMTLDLVDELCYLYPRADFSLLRNALLNNEVTLTKLSPPPRRSQYTNGYPLSSSPTPSTSSTDYMTQQTLQLIKQQNEYVQLLQQSGLNLPVFPNDVTNGLNLADPNSNKYPSWYHPLAHAAAAAAVGLPIPGFGKSGSSVGSNGKKKSSEVENHTFVSPKAPVTNSKAKTVAAALAATRENPAPPSLTTTMKPRKPTQRKRQPRQPKPSTITRPPSEEDFFDPTSILEVTTSTNEEYHGIDLTTTSSSTCNTNVITTATNKEKINGGGIHSPFKVPYVPPPQYPSTSKSLNGHSYPFSAATANLENFIQKVLPSRKSPSENKDTASSESDRAKHLVLDAFSYDPEVAGDSRGVARKFGLNARVVNKWLKEGPSKSLPSIPPVEQKLNGAVLNLNIENSMLAPNTVNRNGTNHNEEEPITSANLRRTILPKTSHNKRKNPKPNQICDFAADPDANGPLDMVVPIKKRRLSTPPPE